MCDESSMVHIYMTEGKVTHCWLFDTTPVQLKASSDGHATCLLTPFDFK